MEELITRVASNNYFIAFVASMFRCFWMFFAFKNKKDSGKVRMSWKVYKKKYWDDYLAALIFPVFLVFAYEWIFTGLVFIFEWDNPWDFFYDTEEFMAIVFGAFGVLIYTKLIAKGEKKIDQI